MDFQDLYVYVHTKLDHLWYMFKYGFQGYVSIMFIREENIKIYTNIIHTVIKGKNGSRMKWNEYKYVI